MTAIRVETTVNAQASCTSLLGHSAGLDLQPHGKSNYIMTQRVRDSGLAYEVQNLKHSRRWCVQDSPAKMQLEFLAQIFL